jgi:fatty-acyl-CoA synthase
MTVTDAVVEKAALVPTPNDDALPRRYSDFDTFCDALDYVAQGEKGLNFHDPRGTLTRPTLTPNCAPTRWRRPAAAAMGVKPGDRIALVAETGPDFARCSAARSMPAPGRCRCRCRPASAARTTISTSSRSSSPARTR